MQMVEETYLINNSKKLNPLTYGLFTIMLIIGSLLFGVEFLILELIMLFVVAGITGILKTYTKTWLLTAVVLTLVVSLLQILFLPGDDVIFRFLIFDITTNGLDRALVIGSRILGIFSPIVFFLAKVDIQDFIIALEQKGINPSVTYIVSSALNAVPQLRKKMNTITDAQKSRGIETEGNLITRMKAFIPIIGPVILSSIVGVEEQTITVEVRGFSYDVQKTRLRVVPDTKKDKNLRRIFSLFILVMVIGRVIMWLL